MVFVSMVQNSYNTYLRYSKGDYQIILNAFITSQWGSGGGATATGIQAGGIQRESFFKV